MHRNKSNKRRPGWARKFEASDGACECGARAPVEVIALGESVEVFCARCGASLAGGALEAAAPAQSAGEYFESLPLDDDPDGGTFESLAAGEVAP